MDGERYIGVVLDYLFSSRYVLKWSIKNVLCENDYFIIVVVNKDNFFEGG